MQKQDSTFSDGLASLRGIAAMAVVAYHALKIFRVGEYDDPFLHHLQWGDGWLFLVQLMLAVFNGRVAVILFFVLSGTVLALSLRGQRSLTPNAIGAFYIRRIFRLFPLLAAVAFISAVLHYVYFDGETLRQATTHGSKFFIHDPNWREIAANAVGLRSRLNPPSWTIFVEIFASLLFPIIYLAVARGYVLTTGTLLLALMFIPLPMKEEAHIYLFSFFIGALIPFYGAGAAKSFFDLSAAARHGIFAAAVSIMLLIHPLFFPVHKGEPIAVFIVTMCAAVIVAVVYFGPATGVLKSKYLLYIGKISYSIYLTHFITLYMLSDALGPFLPAEIAPVTALALNLTLAVVTSVLTILLSALIFNLIERPFQELGRKVADLFTQRSGGRRLVGSLRV